MMQEIKADVVITNSFIMLKFCLIPMKMMLLAGPPGQDYRVDNKRTVEKKMT